MSIRPSSLTKRRAVLAAAEEAFLGGGYAWVTMDEIAERSGVAKQTVYAHFGSKESLFVDLVTSMTREAGDAVYDESLAFDDLEGLRAELERTLGRQLDIVLTPRLLQLRRLVIGEVARFPELARALAEHGPHRAIAALTTLLKTAHRDGLIATADPRAAASQLNWLVMGEPVNDAMLLGDGAVPSTRRRRTHVRRAVATFLAAHAAPVGA